ncbi:MAG: sugar nucleotide-binding protein [Planctomycetota bacterium]|nr:sugar nucleotide-binding protein [Planctomycetota bacterium]
MSMKVLVTGAAGLLGARLVGEFVRRGAVVVAGIHKNPAPAGRSGWDGVSTTVFSDHDLSPLASTLAGGGFTHLVHPAAIRSPEDCREDPDQAYRVNAALVEKMAVLAEENQVKLVYFSTDYIFPGDLPPYPEDNPTRPLNVYGRSKLAGEVAARSAKQHLVARIPALWSLDPEETRSPLAVFLDKLRAGKPFPVDNILVRHYTLAEDIAQALVFLQEKEVSGVINLSAGENQTKADFVRAIARHYRLDPGLVVDSQLPEGGEARPFDASLECSRYLALNGPKLRGVSEVLL